MTDWPEGVARHILGAVDSTMSEAARLAPHLSGPAWILAREQTAARGRRGRVWRSPPGNLAATLLFRPQVALSQWGLYSFVAALALDTALARVSGPHARLSIKWPNDVLLNGGKIAGILLETIGQGPAPAHLAIGFGVNLEAAPPATTVEPGAVTPVSLLGETGITVTPEEFLAPLAMAFARLSRQYETEGFAPIRQAWLSRAARLGQPVTARTQTRTTEGIFETIDEGGAMILRTPRGPQAISAADVFF
ncbi:biotin--[acetyl-CoA-carboxylase] ligase [Sinirhodobacter populi]|uniref:biotin--[biotin carboxyl-carrier protein] ligase n=1 Tax=Paenirhodobacter populi TaxID=2306993 RepID=A0A443KA32_9RHOB|nr:biotin--[acetyl-CoA-carboxylase] ligase [Sinirhodobacter populi]RWR29634.1 biotin--[acetyl-CoA-carboxylase] ligase [Sinirhodobacter populi]